MWLFRGAQSAVFYYAACTPCYEYTYQRQRKREAARSRDLSPPDPSRPTQSLPNADSSNSNPDNNNNLVTEQPRPFKQAPAFSTNAFWSEEIALGPGPPVRRAGEKGRRNRNRNAACRPGSQRTMASPDGRVDPESVREVLRKLKGTPKKEKDRALRALSEKWSRMRAHHQREDEVLWGVDVDMGGGGVKGSSVGFSGPTRAGTDSSIGYESASRAARPDLRYPVIVPNPQSREETRWMLQPPPVAKVMAGKLSPSATPQTSLQTSPRVRPRPPMARGLGMLEEDEDEDWLLSDLLLSDGLSDVTSMSSRPQSPMVMTPTVFHTRPVRTPRNPDELDKDTLKPPPPALLTPSSPHLDLPSPRTKSSPPTLSPIAEPRPTSKETIDSGKAFKVVPPVDFHGEEKVQSIHLEFQPPTTTVKDDLTIPPQRGRRSFRWSMDV